MFEHIPKTILLAYVGGAYLLYLLLLVIYRRFFHPLAKIPGPFWPAVTTWYQTYYSGQYYREIERLHEEYGTILITRTTVQR